MPATSRLLIQVVPRLTPGRCGVSDQAVLLAKGLKDDFGIESAFVVLNSTESSRLPYPEVHCEPAELLESCLELTGGEPGAILVHISGYGYSTDGAPTLLAESLAVSKSSGQFRIAAYFHETFASFPPWKSAFWYSHRQKGALRKIAAQCGLIVTNVHRNAEWLERQSRTVGEASVQLMPVISPAGETDNPTPFAQRNAAMVIFGLAMGRKAAYRQLETAGRLLEILGIGEILDVGPECGHPSEVNGIRVTRMGLMPANELPALFARTQFGFVIHEWSWLARSSVLAACCAQGTIPVVAGPFPKETDGLRDGVNVVSPRTVETLRQTGWESCSRAAWNWYNGHRLSAHVQLYANWVGAP
jgi:hypothetical protein